MSKLLLSVVLTVFCSASFAFYTTTSTSVRDQETWVTVKVSAGSSSKADILFVVDDSGSMDTHQKDLASQAQTIAQNLSFYADLNAAVITTSKYNPSVNAGGKFVGPIINSQNMAFASILAKQLHVGINGDATEQPFTTLMAATSEPLISTTNKDFLRADADLIVVFITDTEDQSTSIKAPDLYAHLKGLVPNSDLHIISIMTEDPKTCTGEEDELSKFTGLKDLTKLASGQLVSLCSDFSQEIPKAIKNIKAFSKEISISALPNTKIDAASLKVSADGKTPLTAGDLLDGWVFDSAQGKIILGDNVVQNLKFSFIEINYKVLPL